MEEVSGGRMHYMFNRVGGLKEELPAGWLDRRRRGRRRGPRAAARRSRTSIFGNEIFQARTRGVGVLSRRAGRRVRRLRADRPGVRASTSTCAATSPTSRTTSSPRRRAPGVHPHRGRLLRPVRDPARPGQGLARPRGRLPRPAAVAAARADQRAAAEDPQGAGGVDVRLDREPARHQRLLPGVPRREDTVAAEAALRFVQQRRGAARGAPRLLVADMVAILGSMFFVVGDIDK